jgi:FKBP-type peptidyl-prolyl cis-trans isomerase SlyD
MQIKKHSAAAIDYQLTIDDGIVVDASEKGDPLWYLHGVGNLIPGLEKELEGMKVGDEKTVVVEPAQGYGVRDDDRVHVVPRQEFPPSTSFELGDVVVARGPSGEELEARVTAIDAKNVTVDFNHELAGKTLTFQVKVQEIRPATKEELAHGHVHGPGAHHH